MPDCRGGPSGEEGGEDIVLEKRGRAGDWPAADVVHTSTAGCLDPSQKTFFDLRAMARSHFPIHVKTRDQNFWETSLLGIARHPSRFARHPPPHTHTPPATHLKPQHSQRAPHTALYSSTHALSLVPDKKERCFGQASITSTVSSPRLGNSSFVHVADAAWSSDEAQP
ncbi:unnamed protein product [Ectocarpus sp. 12 AP-2014]